MKRSTATTATTRRKLVRRLAGELTPARDSGSAYVILALFAAVIVGILPAVLPLVATLAVCVGGLLAVGAVALRRTLRGGSLRTALADTTEREEPPAPAGDPRASSDRELRVSRMLFYLGTLTVTEAAWRPAFGLTLSEMLFLAAFVGCVLAVVRGRALAPVPPFLLAGVGIFALGGAISSLNAHDATQSGVEVLHAVYVLLLWAWAGAMVLRRREHVLVAMTLWGISAAANGVAALTQVFGVEALAGPLEGSRATGFTQHPNDLGGATGVALVPCLLLATRSGSAGTTVTVLLRWLLVALVAIGLVLSASVAGMACGLVAMVVWLISPSVGTLGRTAILAALASTLVVLTLAGGRVTTPAERVEQVTSPPGTQPVSGTAQQRVSIIETAWPRIEDDPFVGTGIDPAGTVVTIVSGGQTLYHQAHGAVIAAWYETGIFGLIGILVIFGALAVAGLRASAAPEDEADRLIGWALLAAFVGFVAFAMGVPFVFQQYGWFAGVLLVAWWGIMQTRVATLPRSAPQAASNGQPLPTS